MAEKVKDKTTRNPKNHFDVIVWGANLTGVVLATKLSLAGQKVLLIEEKEVPGGYLAPVKTLKGSLKANIDLIPANEEFRSEFHLLEELLGYNPIAGTQKISPTTFHEGQFKSFTGFGNKPFLSTDVLDFYNTQEIFTLNGSPEEWIQSIHQNFEGETLFRSEVTDIIITSGEVTSIVVNGAKTYTADKYINCLSPKDTIAKASPFDALTPKIRQQISKAHFWTTVCLHYAHPVVVSEKKDPHFLMGNKFDHEPCLGRFLPPSEPENTESAEASFDHAQHSVWTSFIPSEAAEDDDFVGGVIRHMKKQIKRAYPDFFEHISNEKITIHSDSHGVLDLNLKEFGKLPKISSYYLSSSFISEKPNIIGNLNTANQILLPLLLNPSPSTDTPQQASPTT